MSKIIDIKGKLRGTPIAVRDKVYNAIFEFNGRKAIRNIGCFGSDSAALAHARTFLTGSVLVELLNLPIHISVEEV